MCRIYKNWMYLRMRCVSMVYTVLAPSEASPPATQLVKATPTLEYLNIFDNVWGDHGYESNRSRRALPLFIDTASQPYFQQHSGGRRCGTGNTAVLTDHVSQFPYFEYWLERSGEGCCLQSTSGYRRDVW